VGKPKGKRPLGRPRHMGVDNVRWILREIGWDRVNRIDLAQDRNELKELMRMH
jgi:hypothetical protein